MLKYPSQLDSSETSVAVRIVEEIPKYTVYQSEEQDTGI